MTCAACSNRIEKVLNKMDGVDAKVNLATEQATVDYDKNNIRLDDITNKIENLGYGVQYDEVEFDISGMTCAACSNRIEKVLNKTDGVSNATVNLATENAVIEYNSNVLSERDLLPASTIWATVPQQRKVLNQEKKRKAKNCPG